MELKSIILKNFTRLHVTGIKELTYRPVRTMQIILASNGSGKSSLLKEVIPNVEDLNNDYGKGGSREAIYSHNGDKYILSYDRDTKSHSFIVNGKELNQAGLQKIQKILIEEHFKITKPVHELLTSTASLTTMSINERKKWFTEILSSTNYDYALDVYTKAKHRIRDLTSYIKLTQSKILQDEELFKVMTPEDIKIMKHDRDILQKVIDNALTSKVNNITIDKPDFELLKELNKNLLLYVSKLPKDRTITLDSLNKDIILSEQEILNLNDRLKRIDESLGKIDKLKVEENISAKSIEDEISRIDFMISHNEHLDNTLTLVKLRDLVLFLDNNYDLLIDYANSLFELRDITVGPETILEYSISVEQLDNELNKIINLISKIETELNIQLKHKEQDDVTCPKCNFNFKPNLDTTQLTRLEEELKVYLDKKESLLKEHTKKKDTLTRMVDKNSLVTKLITLLKSNNTILYNWIKFKTDDFNKLDSLGTIINDLRLTTPPASTIEEAMIKRADLVRKLEVYTKLSSEKIAVIRNKRQELIDDRITTISKINDIKSKLVITKKHLTNLNKIKSYRADMINILRLYRIYKKDLKDTTYNEYLNDVIKLTKDKIYDIEAKISEFNNVKEHYNSLKKELAKYEIDLKANKKIEEYLSPTKGLIGSSISSTINIILEKMNHIINQVWKQEIYILPCDVDEVGLTFKFPVRINEVKTIPDIIKGSSSIKEIIDLAFKITAMELLDMLQYPLILDEFSKTMDPVHRVASYDYIAKLSKDNFSQIFMVSHYESMYNRFNNTDVVILNNDNIGYEGDYNEVMEIKK